MNAVLKNLVLAGLVVVLSPAELAAETIAEKTHNSMRERLEKLGKHANGVLDMKKDDSDWRHHCMDLHAQDMREWLDDLDQLEMSGAAEDVRQGSEYLERLDLLQLALQQMAGIAAVRHGHDWKMNSQHHQKLASSKDLEAHGKTLDETLFAVKNSKTQGGMRKLMGIYSLHIWEHLELLQGYLESPSRAMPGQEKIRMQHLHLVMKHLLNHLEQETRLWGLKK